MVGVFYIPSNQEEVVDKAFKQLMEASKSKNVVLVWDINYWNICWEENTTVQKQSSLWSVLGIPLIQMVEAPTSGDLMLTVREELVETVRVESNLGDSSHE